MVTESFEFSHPVSRPRSVSLSKSQYTTSSNFFPPDLPAYSFSVSFADFSSVGSQRPRIHPGPPSVLSLYIVPGKWLRLPNLYPQLSLLT